MNRGVRMKRVFLAVVLLSALVAVRGRPMSSASASPALRSRFVPFASPTRLVDSRSGLGTTKAPLAPMTGRDLQIAGAAVPSTATAVVLNAAVTNTTGNGWLQIFPTGRANVGDSSTLNLDFAGSAIANASFTPLGDGGRLTIYSTFGTDFIIDIFGYFEPAESSAAGRFVGVTPSRLLDTRSRLGWKPSNPGDAKDCSSFPDRLAAQEWYEAFFDLYGDIANLDADGDGIVCELNEKPPSTNPPPTNPPATNPPATNPPATNPPSTNKPANPGDTKNCGDFATYAAAKAWFDLYFPYYGDIAKLDADGNGMPCESRPGGPSALTAAQGVRRVLPETTITLSATGFAGVPASGVAAVVLNVTAVDPKSTGWVQVSPTPVAVGQSSNLNTTAGVTAANLVVVPVGAGGKIDLYSTTGGDVLVDVFGYFTDASSDVSSTGLFVSLTPARALDTRTKSAGAGIATGSTTSVDLSAVTGRAVAVTGNLTSTNSRSGGYLQISPAPIAAQAHSNLNTSYTGQTVANAVVSPLPTSSGLAPIVQIYNYLSADVLFDVTGYFAGS
jgi:hypothetical protein